MRKLDCRDRWDIKRCHNELAVRAGLSRPARGYSSRVIREELRSILTPSTISWKDPRAAEYDRRYGEAMRRAKHYRIKDTEAGKP